MRHPVRWTIAAMAVPVCVLAGAGPARAASSTAKVSANVLKPLTLTRVQDLELGTIVIGPGTWSGATVGISRAGVFSCASPNVTCSGATQVAKYNVTGSNSQPVRISAPDVTLVNQSDAARTLTLAVDSPGTISLPNSGNKGVTFSLGGSIAVSSSTADGIYFGTFNVTVDY